MLRRALKNAPVQRCPESNGKLDKEAMTGRGTNPDLKGNKFAIPARVWYGFCYEICPDGRPISRGEAAR